LRVYAACRLARGIKDGFFRCQKSLQANI